MRGIATSQLGAPEDDGDIKTSDETLQIHAIPGKKKLKQSLKPSSSGCARVQNGVDGCFESTALVSLKEKIVKIACQIIREDDHQGTGHPR
jgi:hypothetical protein